MRNLTLLAVALSACVTLVPRDGFQLREDWWAADEQMLRTQAAAEMDCAAPALTLQVLGVFDSAFANLVSVTGCDKRKTYVRDQHDYASQWKPMKVP
jgi:hypothetical protein